MAGRKNFTHHPPEHLLDLDRVPVVERAAILVPCSSAASSAYPRPVVAFQLRAGVSRTCFDFLPKLFSFAEGAVSVAGRLPGFGRTAKKKHCRAHARQCMNLCQRKPTER
jgi:hypothetical protein